LRRISKNIKMGRFIAKIIRMHMCVENEVVRWKFILEDRMFKV